MLRPTRRATIREPAVAGSFYPGSAPALARTVDQLLDEAAVAPPAQARHRLRGVIAPHAGYVYSGPVAASAYALVRAVHARPLGVIILGPSHFWPLRGAALASHSAWRTPLGDIVVDAARRERSLAAGLVVDDAAHASEHSIEVQLPFLQRLWPDGSWPPVLPIAVGQGPPEALARSLAAILDDDSLLVVSTDLSHYRSAAEARRLDTRTAAAIEALDHGAIGDDDACGCQPVRAALLWVRQKGLTVRLLDLRDSAHTAGSPDRVVGYGAFAIEGPAPD